MLEIWCDSSYDKDSNLATFCGVFIKENEKKVIQSILPKENKMTSCRAEMLAAFYLLKHLIKPCQLVVYSDNQNLINKMLEFDDLQPQAKDYDVLEKLNILSFYHQITWKWVKGHSTYIYNVEADKIARSLLRNTLNIINP
jgi:ribonuclease HI